MREDTDTPAATPPTIDGAGAAALAPPVVPFTSGAAPRAVMPARAAVTPQGTKLWISLASAASVQVVAGLVLLGLTFGLSVAGPVRLAPGAVRDALVNPLSFAFDALSALAAAEEAPAWIAAAIVLALPVALVAGLWALRVVFRALIGLRAPLLMPALISLAAGAAGHLSAGQAGLAVGAAGLLATTLWLSTQIRSRPRLGTSLSAAPQPSPRWGAGPEPVRAAAPPAPLAVAASAEAPAASRRASVPPPFLG